MVQLLGPRSAFTLAGVGRYDASTCSGSLDSWCMSITWASERSWCSSASSRRRSSRSGSAHRNSTAIAAKTTSLMVLSISGSQSKLLFGPSSAASTSTSTSATRDAATISRTEGSGHQPGAARARRRVVGVAIHHDDQLLEVSRDRTQAAGRVEAGVDPLVQPGHRACQLRALELPVTRHAASVPRPRSCRAICASRPSVSRGSP